MEFSLIAGWVGGLAGAIAMTALMKMGTRWARATRPRMEFAAGFHGDATYEVQPGSLRIAPPGFFGLNYGGRTPMGLLMGHAVYGLVLALIYNALV